MVGQSLPVRAAGLSRARHFVSILFLYKPSVSAHHSSASERRPTINLKSFHLLRREDFLRDLEINYLGAVTTIQHYLPQLKKAQSASIVLMSTVAVQTGLAFHASISGAKGAIEGLTHALAAELAPKIRVNAVAPSLTDTPLAEALLNQPAKRENAAKRHPLRRIGTSSDIASTVCFLLGEESSWMTGQVLAVDGGLSRIRQLT